MAAIINAVQVFGVDRLLKMRANRLSCVNRLQEMRSRTLKLWFSVLEYEDEPNLLRLPLAE